MEKKENVEIYKYKNKKTSHNGWKQTQQNKQNNLHF
jgi:hypothetical protein